MTALCEQKGDVIMPDTCLLCEEPVTFAEVSTFLRDRNRDYLNGRISWESLWYYEQRYTFRRDTIVAVGHEPEEGEADENTTSSQPS